MIHFNYDRGFVDISMSDYVKGALKRLLHKEGTNPQYSPVEHLGVNWTKKWDR